MADTMVHQPAAASQEAPYYLPQGTERELFELAWRNRLPLLLKGPTGCGKTRFVAHMAHRLGLPLHTVACHDDLTAADLTGRWLLKGGETVWVDGPLTRAVREGGICYLDEVVEARKDVTVVLHPLDRRPPHASARAHRRAAPRPAELHARRLLQPGLPEHPQEPEAQHPPTLPCPRARLPGARAGAGDRRGRERPTGRAGAAADQPRRAPAPAQGRRPRGVGLDQAPRLHGEPDPPRPRRRPPRWRPA